VPRPELTELVARALGLLGSELAWVVHGADGLDEISTTGYTKVSELRHGCVRTFYVHPADFGLPKARPSDLAGGDAAANAAIAGQILAGEGGPRRDVVLLNAGAGLFVAGRAASVPDGIARAAVAIDNGAAARLLARVRAISRAEATACAPRPPPRPTCSPPSWPRRGAPWRCGRSSCRARRSRPRRRAGSLGARRCWPRSPPLAST
jgi:hypothetical protein